MHVPIVDLRGSILKKVRQWLSGGARSPKEAIIKDRLREMLSS